MLLALTRGLRNWLPEQHKGEWDSTAFPMPKMWELKGRTMLVVGLGGIGTELARRAHGLGMRVVATRASAADKPPFVEYVGKPSDLLKLAAEADVVVNCTPLLPSTLNLFDAEFFTAMKAGGYFINVGRGKSVVQDNLVAALKSGQLAGAGLDVTEPEPLPADHPLWQMPNVIITPHIAATSDRVFSRVFLLAQENVRRYVRGDPLLSVVDPARGY
jgi:phosphoglycerate dehydrogenase-like enzyme